MPYSGAARVLAIYLLYFAVMLLVPFGVALLYELHLEPDFHLPIAASTAFLETILVVLAFAGSLWLMGKKAHGAPLGRRESILVVVIIWFLTAALSSLPFVLSQALENPVDAYFEAMSGLTTTGATIIETKMFDAASGAEVAITQRNPLQPEMTYTFFGSIHPTVSHDGATVATGVEALGKPLLFWRSLLSWIGGIGVVVLFVAILPALSGGGKFLYETEVAGPTKEGMTPRIKETAAYLWKIYIFFTLTLIGLLFLADSSLGWFELVTLAFGTISTGGFYVKDACLSQNVNGLTIGIMTLFMIIGGMNFSLFFHCLKKRLHYLNDPELIAYLWLLICGGLLLATSLWLSGYPLDECLLSIVQAVSTMTSTGYSFVDYDGWRMPFQLMLIILIYIGGMSGSTSGGVKVRRYLVVWHIIVNKVEQFFRPEVVRVIKIGDKETSEKGASVVLTFFVLMLFFVVLGTFMLVLDDVDPLTAVGVISSTINNNGLYFGGIGCTSSLGFLSDYSKVIVILWMVLGRLEFLSILALLTPAFWRKH